MKKNTDTRGTLRGKATTLLDRICKVDPERDLLHGTSKLVGLANELVHMRETSLLTDVDRDDKKDQKLLLYRDNDMHLLAQEIYAQSSTLNEEPPKICPEHSILYQEFDPTKNTHTMFVSLHGNHWVGFTVDKTTHTITVSNPLGQESHYTGSEKKIIQELTEKLNLKDYTTVYDPKQPLQIGGDGVNCGPYVIALYEKRMLNTQKPIKADSGNDIRKTQQIVLLQKIENSIKDIEAEYDQKTNTKEFKDKQEKLKNIALEVGTPLDKIITLALQSSVNYDDLVKIYDLYKTQEPTVGAFPRLIEAKKIKNIAQLKSFIMYCHGQNFNKNDKSRISEVVEKLSAWEAWKVKKNPSIDTVPQFLKDMTEIKNKYSLPHEKSIDLEDFKQTCEECLLDHLSGQLRQVAPNFNNIMNQIKDPVGIAEVNIPQQQSAQQAAQNPHLEEPSALTTQEQESIRKIVKEGGEKAEGRLTEDDLANVLVGVKAGKFQDIGYNEGKVEEFVDNQRAALKTYEQQLVNNKKSGGPNIGI